MAARGSISKENIIAKLLETFEGSFVYGKEVRIPMIEDGAEVQIKVALTCAKENVERGGDTAVPNAEIPKQNPADQPIQEITVEEKQEVEDLISRLGL